MTFAEDFLWGVATSSYQIEGASPGHGRGECIWHRFSHSPGRVYNNDNGDLACDHYHRYREDVALLKELGVNAYRFSISWPRVIPDGVGERNPEGLDFYDRLVDELLGVGIAPFVTLYHWDLPQALQDRGGWENPESIRWFADYADLMSRRLGDRARHWITHNEPWVIAMLGNLMGIHAPGKSDARAAYRVAHHVLLSHAEAVPILRGNVSSGRVGITLNLTPIYPVSDKPEDIAAAKRADGFQNRWFLDPLFRGEYPADFVAHLHDRGDVLDGIDPGAVAILPDRTIDFLGVNYYTRNLVKAGDDDSFLNISYVRNETAEYTAMGWEVAPEALRQLLVDLHHDYNPSAILITENGSAFDDPEPRNGIVDDPKRVAYLQSHLHALERAIQSGVPVRGYFAWSFMDNFEWAEGYSKRFGLYYVDYATLKRCAKQSALYYRRYIRERIN